MNKMLTKTKKIEKIIKVLEKRNLMIESTGFKERIPQMSDEMINSLYDLVSNYIQIEKNIYDKLMDGYIEILDSQPVSDIVKLKFKELSKTLKILLMNSEQ